MTRYFFHAAILSAAIIITTASGAEVSKPHWSNCTAAPTRSNADQAIAVCTAKIADIESGKRWKDSQPYLYRAVGYQIKGDAKRALADIKEGLKIAQLGPQINSRAVTFHSLEGEIYHYILKDYDAAIAKYTYLINGGPQTYGDYYGLRGFSYLAKGDKVRALADFESALKIGKLGSNEFRKRIELYFHTLKKNN